ncbi:MAG: hypothetical protein JW862_03540 [Anaerolineales bacterium]|nr:hypothetical protein [Anaerolineales bacterium]
MSTDNEEKDIDVQIQNNSGGTFYGLGLIGAWVYYFQRATTTEARVRAFFKGLAWPAFLVYELLEFLQKED